MLRQQSQAGQSSAKLAYMFALSKGVKGAEEEWFNPAAFVLSRREAQATVRPPVARTFLELQKENKVPNWVAMCLDTKLMRLSAGE